MCLCILTSYQYCIELISWEVDLVGVDFMGVDFIGEHFLQSHSHATPGQNLNLNPILNEVAV